MRKFSNHGQLVKHNHEIEGINSRLDGMQAAILSAKLPYIKKWSRQRLDAALLYNDLLFVVIIPPSPEVIWCE